MIIRKEERNTAETQGLKGGEGLAILHRYVPKDMPYHSRLFTELELNPGVSLGLHRHEGDYEIYFFTEGEMVLNDNGAERVVCAGDFAICYDGESHGLRNDSDRPAKLLAVIVTKD